MGLAINQIYEKNPNAVKNYGIWLRYQPDGPAQHVQGVPRSYDQRSGVPDVRGDVGSPPGPRGIGHHHEDRGHPGFQGASRPREADAEQQAQVPGRSQASLRGEEAPVDLLGQAPDHLRQVSGPRFNDLIATSQYK